MAIQRIRLNLSEYRVYRVTFCHRRLRRTIREVKDGEREACNSELY